MFFWVTVYCHARDWPCLQNYIFQHFAWKVPALVYLVDGPLREKKEGEQSFQFMNCKVSELVEIQMSYQVILVQVFSAVYPKHVVCTFTTIVFTNYECQKWTMSQLPIEYINRRASAEPFIAMTKNWGDIGEILTNNAWCDRFQSELDINTRDLSNLSCAFSNTKPQKPTSWMSHGYRKRSRSRITFRSMTMIVTP